MLQQLIKMQEKNKNSLFYRLLFLLKFVGTGFVSSKISSHVIAESCIILAKDFWFSQLHVAGFQI